MALPLGSLRQSESLKDLFEFRSASAEPRIRFNLKVSQGQPPSVNPLPVREVEALRIPTNPKIGYESLPDIYRRSVKCMNQIIKEVLPQSKENAQALFDKAEKENKLLPQHRDKVISALRSRE